MIQVSETEIRERIAQLRAIPTNGRAQELYLKGLITGLEWAVADNDYKIGLVAELVKEL